MKRIFLVEYTFEKLLWNLGRVASFSYSLIQLSFPVSNETPEHPVVSPVSGCIYERRLIEKYINDSGSDPMNGDKLSIDMLIDVKCKCISITQDTW